MIFKDHFRSKMAELNQNKSSIQIDRSSAE